MNVARKSLPQQIYFVARVGQIYRKVNMNDLEQQSIEQFNIWATNFDQKRFWPFYFSNKAVLQALSPHWNSSILDVGCGTGILLQQLLQLDRGIRLYGIDIAPEMVKTAQAKFAEESVIIKQGTAHSLPYKNDSFDYVACATSFHHYPDPEGSLREILRVLKVGGKFVLLDPFTTGFLRKVICQILNTVHKEKDTNLFTREQMYNMFQNTGFRHIEQKNYLYYKLITVGIKPEKK